MHSFSTYNAIFCELDLSWKDLKKRLKSKINVQNWGLVNRKDMFGSSWSNFLGLVNWINWSLVNRKEDMLRIEI